MAGAGWGEGFLARVGEGPPTPGLRVGGDAGPVGVVVLAGVLVVAEQQITVQEDGEVADVGVE